MPCRPELGGVFCRLCASNASASMYYVAASEASPATCSPCRNFTPFLVLMFVGAVGAWVLLRVGRRVWLRSDKQRRERIARRWAAYGLGTKLKSVVSFYQIACKVSVVYQVVLPPETSALLAAFEVAISLGLDLTAPFECLGASSYLSRLQFWIFAPLLLAGSLVAIGVLTHRRDWRRGALWALPLIFKLMFILYTTVNLRAFEAFRCFDFGVDGRWLMADVQVACDSPEHATIIGWAWLAVLLYPIGWTATTAVLLAVARKAITGKARETALSRALSFVYGEYAPEFFWWEVLEMVRRFLLAGLMSIVNEGSVVQIVLATLFCILYLVIQLQAKPFKNPSDDYVALASSASLAVLFFSCVVLKVGTSTPLPDPSHALPP